MTIVPQLTLYTPAEVSTQLQLQQPAHARKRAVFLPVLVGLSLTASLAGLGLSGGSLGHSLWALGDLHQKLEGALASTAEFLASLQRQVTSLAQVTLQNRRALDLLTAEKGGTCLFLGEECCYYVNESGLVETNIIKLTDIASSLRSPPPSHPLSSFLHNPLLAWVWPLLGPLVVLLLGCLFLPCLIKFLQTQMGKISNQTFNQLLLRTTNGYYPLHQPRGSTEQLTSC